MFTTARQWILCCVLIPALVPPDAMAQSAEVGIEPVWEKKTGSVIYAGVTIDEERLYAGTEDGVLHAIDRESGKIAWTHDAGAAIASRAAVDDQRVYFHGRDGVVSALNREDGSPAWTFATGGERQWDYWDYYLSTPAVDDRQLYFGSGDHHVYAVDKRTGHLRWKVKTGNIVHGEPLISGEKVIVGGFDGRLRAIDRGTGRVLWTFKTVGNAYFRNGELPGAAAAGDGMVYVGARDYNLYAVLADTGTGAWNDRTPSWIVGRPLVLDDEVIVTNSDGAAILSYNRTTGQKNWQVQNSYNMFAGAKPLGAGHLAVASLDGRITILARADGATVAIHESEGSRDNRDRFFTAEGQLDYSGLKSLEDLMALYDRQLAAMDGIAGEFAVDGDTIWYATVSGTIMAVRARGIEKPETEQP